MTITESIEISSGSQIQTDANIEHTYLYKTTEAQLEVNLYIYDIYSKSVIFKFRKYFRSRLAVIEREQRDILRMPCSDNPTEDDDRIDKIVLSRKNEQKSRSLTLL